MLSLKNVVDFSSVPANAFKINVETQIENISIFEEERFEKENELMSDKKTVTPSIKVSKVDHFAEEIQQLVDEMSPRLASLRSKESRKLTLKDGSVSEIIIPDSPPRHQGNSCLYECQKDVIGDERTLCRWNNIVLDLDHYKTEGIPD